MKKLGLLIAVGSSLTLAACNNGGGAGSPSKPAATTTATPVMGAGGMNNGAGGPPPPPSQSKNGSPASTQHRDDDLIVSHNTSVVATPPARKDGPATDVGGTTTPDTDHTAPSIPPATIPAPAPQTGGQCGADYQAPSEWFPGLPAAPSAQPIFTDLAGSSGVRFTDARQDSLFAVAVDRANGLPAAMQKGNQDFAKLIRDVKISVDNHTKEVKVRVTYLHHMMKAGVDLRGVMEKPTEVGLVQVPVAGQKPTGQAFGGVLTCADADRGCKNILLRLDLKSSAGKILRSIYVVHRWGDAHITMSEQERRQFARLPNQNQSAFAEYLSNTVNNHCLNTLADVQAGHRDLPACAISRLKETCGGEDVKRPSARAFGMRSWAVAYGRSGFELALFSNGAYDGVADFEQKISPYLTIHGPLAYNAAAKTAPVYSHPLATTGSAKGVGDVFLMNNDGGGNLNLRFDFLGSQNATSRVSVSSLLPNTAYSQSVVQTAQQAPTVPQQDVEQQESVSDEGIAEPSDLN